MILSLETENIKTEEKTRQIKKLEKELSDAWAHIHHLAEDSEFNEEQKNAGERKRAAALKITNQKLIVQNKEKEKRAAELVIANKELAFQNKEKEKRAAELIIANKELAFQNKEKEKRAAELIIANKELAFQNKEKEKRAAELIIANKKLGEQSKEKGKRAAELIIANKKLGIQNKEKEKRAAELIIANKELVFQNKEKQKRATELTKVNKELAYQNKQRKNRTAELVVANTELAFQYKEKKDRAAELVVANKELAFQNKEKEKRAAELMIANKELQSFTFISSHDLQEPLRKIRVFLTRILEEEKEALSSNGKNYLTKIHQAAERMQQLIQDILAFSQLNTAEKELKLTDLTAIVKQVLVEFKDILVKKKAVIEYEPLCKANIIPSQFYHLVRNLVDNSIKFANPKIPLKIIIKSRIVKASKLKLQNINGGLAFKNYCHITFSDNGTGFDPQYKERIFEVFQKIHDKALFGGTGIGLAIVKKIVDNHQGFIVATGKMNKGATFDIYLPVE